MKLLISISRGPIQKLNDLKLQEVLKKKWPTVRVLNSRLISGDQRNAEYAYITADATSGNYLINRVVLGATGLGTNSFKIEKTSPAYGDFETMYDAVNELHSIDAPALVRSTSNSPPLSSLTYYLSDFMVQAGPEIDRLLIDWRNEQTIAPLAYACYNPRDDSVELQLIEASRDHRQWIKDKFFDALQELFKKVKHRMPVSIPISTRENFRRESVQSISALKSKSHIQEPSMKITIQVRAADSIESTSATKFKVKDGVLYIPSDAKAAFSKAISEISKAGELIKKGAPLMDFYDDSSKLQHGNPGRYKHEAAKRKTSKTEYVAAHKEAAKHIQAAKAALKEAGYGSIRPAFGSEIITKNGKSNISYVNKFKADTFRAPGQDERLKVKFIEASKLKSISGAALPEDNEVIDSESAAKTPAHIFAQVKGDTTLVIDRSHKSTVSSALQNARKAKRLAAGALKAKIDSTSAHSQASRAEGTAKERLVTKYKTLKTKASADAKEAKELLRTAAASLRKAGLSSVALALSASTITLTTLPGKSLRTVNAAQVDQLRIKGKKGTFKPKFGDVAKILASSGKKPSHAESVKRGVKKVADKRAIAAKVDKALPRMLNTVGITFDTTKKAGAVTHNVPGMKGKPIGSNSINLTELRMHMEDKKIPVQKNKNGFEVPGVIRFTATDKGVKFQRLDK